MSFTFHQAAKTAVHKTDLFFGLGFGCLQDEQKPVWSSLLILLQKFIENNLSWKLEWLNPPKQVLQIIERYFCLGKKVNQFQYFL